MFNMIIYLHQRLFCFCTVRERLVVILFSDFLTIDPSLFLKLLSSSLAELILPIFICFRYYFSFPGIILVFSSIFSSLTLLSWASNLFNWRINPLFGPMYGRPFFMKDRVYFDPHRFFLMRYAAKRVVDLDTPAKQCTKTFPVVSPWSMKSKLL